ncbi:MAG: tyrosine--tRNA ligase [Planctomycetes bacterium]|jgi:tyrosyl-tRNA synthetase|nr:tyrosine--tRNA ligase [Planctomycetota bacterium]HPY75960.1 tyrosine--tRNA ligase [Planctomycetota bacterium]HQB01487.1 tyrosine--tRNA ligase [Planctomycetota bacterium]HRU52518.1 tyrosine--tRNA ligase [Planctomycetota bacterium]
MNIYQELQARGFIYQETDSQAIEEQLMTKNVVHYCGFDPTGNSLHVGHLLPVMAMRLMQKAGHIPTILVGGATGRIGDPSGRSTARNMLDEETINQNVQSIHQQLAHFIDPNKSIFVNNYDWFKNINILDFLRDIGSKFPVNRMLAQKSVESRLENGLSFLEFSYSLLQGYDFYYLYKTHNCTLQIGGQDQWGNMVAGTELIRKMYDDTHQAHCLTIPLLINPSTGQKFGKSIGGTSVWLDKTQTPVFDYYQFWRNTEDTMVEDLLKKFAIDLPVQEAIDLAHSNNINRAKEILAYEATKQAHSEEEALNAYLAAGAKFGFSDPENKISTTSNITKANISNIQAQLPTVELPYSHFQNNDLWIAKLMQLAGFCKSTSEARRLIQGGGVTLNEKKITDINYTITESDIQNNTLLLKTGKKTFKNIKIIHN